MAHSNANGWGSFPRLAPSLRSIAVELALKVCHEMATAANVVAELTALRLEALQPESELSAAAQEISDRLDAMHNSLAGDTDLEFDAQITAPPRPHLTLVRNDPATADGRHVPPSVEFGA